jgi:hypothetical protein
MKHLRMLLPWLLLVLVALSVAAIRYGMIEASVFGHGCEMQPDTLPCAFRQAVIAGFIDYGYGYAALLASALALLWKRSAPAWLAAALGLLALQLYCVEAGAFALLTGCLRLLRSQAADEQQGRGEGEIEAQP